MTWWFTCHLSLQLAWCIVWQVAWGDRVTSHRAYFWHEENDCSWEWVRKPIRNTSCSLRGTQCDRLLILIGWIGHSDLVMLIRIKIEGCHMEQRWPATWPHGEAPIMPPFNPIVSSGQKMRVKTFFKPFSMVAWHVAFRGHLRRGVVIEVAARRRLALDGAFLGALSFGFLGSLFL